MNTEIVKSAYQRSNDNNRGNKKNEQHNETKTYRTNIQTQVNNNNGRVTAMRKWGVKGRMKVMIRFHTINVLTDHHKKLKYEHIQNKTLSASFFLVFRMRISSFSFCFLYLYSRSAKTQTQAYISLFCLRQQLQRKLKRATIHSKGCVRSSFEGLPMFCRRL